MTRMQDPSQATALFIMFALVTGAVVFGGSTLAYFLEKRRPVPPKPEPAQARHRRTDTDVTAHPALVSRDEAA